MTVFVTISWFSCCYGNTQCSNTASLVSIAELILLMFVLLEARKLYFHTEKLCFRSSSLLLCLARPSSHSFHSFLCLLSPYIGVQFNFLNRLQRGGVRRLIKASLMLVSFSTKCYSFSPALHLGRLTFAFLSSYSNIQKIIFLGIRGETGGRKAAD